MCILFVPPGLVFNMLYCPDVCLIVKLHPVLFLTIEARYRTHSQQLRHAFQRFPPPLGRHPLGLGHCRVRRPHLATPGHAPEGRRQYPRRRQCLPPHHAPRRLHHVRREVHGRQRLPGGPAQPAHRRREPRRDGRLPPQWHHGEQRQRGLAGLPHRPGPGQGRDLRALDAAEPRPHQRRHQRLRAELRHRQRRRPHARDARLPLGHLDARDHRALHPPRQRQRHHRGLRPARQRPVQGPHRAAAGAVQEAGARRHAHRRRPPGERPRRRHSPGRRRLRQDGQHLVRQHQGRRVARLARGPPAAAPAAARERGQQLTIKSGASVLHHHPHRRVSEIIERIVTAAG
ncbi:hypothetical protein CGRA01v4_05923 [Colletotrichum graminicola]|nr:hypothetical protein CGRA01v4_05923 [Colletotrichum graminicola]